MATASSKPAPDLATTDGRHTWLAIAARVVLGLVLLWLSLAVAIDGVFATRQPVLAMRLWPFGGDARSALGEQLMNGRESGAGVARVTSLATQALARSPVDSRAAAVLAMVATAENDVNLAMRRNRYAERLSRRNVQAQLLMIEERVGQGDVAGALVHYDRALRVSNSAREVLLPVLAQAAARPEIAARLVPFVKARPPWWSDFVDQLVAEGSPAAAVANVIPGIALGTASEIERDRLELALRKLVTAGDYTAARAAYAAARSPALADAPIRDGSFEDEPLLAPFDWWFASEAGLAAAREQREGADGAYALSLVRDPGKTGEVANQFLRLKPGRYRLSAKVGDIAASEIDRPRIRLRCAASNDLIADLVLPNTEGKVGAFSGEFTVPEGCQGQWLVLATGAGIDADTGIPWIDSLTVASL